MPSVRFDGRGGDPQGAGARYATPRARVRLEGLGVACASIGPGRAELLFGSWGRDRRRTFLQGWIAHRFRLLPLE